MAATSNGKNIVLNETFLLDEGRTIEISGAFPLRIYADASSAKPFGLAVENGAFCLNLTGLSQQNYDQVGYGPVQAAGKAYTVAYQCTLAGNVNGVNIYKAAITLFDG